MKKSVRITIILTILVSLLGNIPPQSARAATEWMVTNSNSSGAGSLRQAILDAASGDTITFVPELSGANIYILTGMTITKDITIDATNLNAPITLDGQEGNRLFQINSGYAVVLRGFVVKNGYYNGSGGTIYNEGTLSISDCSILDSVANSFGGAIFNTGTLNIENCTFLNNHSIQASGGAIANWSGNLTVQNSSFIGNYADEGGGVRIFNGQAVFVNTTFFGNAPSAIHSSGKLTLRNSTIGGGSSGVVAGGNYSTGSNTSELHILNSIIANHGSGQDCYNGGSQLLTNIHNLIESGNCGSPLLTDDPLLELPSDNGGPTQTMALLPGSPAFNAGDNNTCEETDQRGITRPQGSQCDIGAYEYVYTSSYVMNTNDSGPGSLRQAIANAADGDTITFDSSLAGQTIYLASELEVAKSITIDGSNLEPRIALSGDTDADGVGDVPIMSIVENSSVNIYSIDLKNGKYDYLYKAGGITNSGSLKIENCTFSGNTGGMGGSILNNGDLTIQNCTITDNTAYDEGGGIANYGNLLITNSAITSNDASNGGGIFSDSSAFSLLIANSTIADNEATSSGGGVHVLGGTAHSINNTFSDNKSVNGGNIYSVSGSTFYFANTIVSTTIPSQNNCAGAGTIDVGTGELIGVGNLATDDTCGSATQVTLGMLNLSPTLADNGGPTQTIALQSGSVAIDAGDVTMCSNAPVINVDQRGVTRPQGSQCDIGAYEYVYTSSYVTNTNNSGLGSLRQAIADATDGDTITFASNLAGQTIYLTSELEVDKSITIDGSNLEPRITVSGDTDADGSGDVQIMTIGVDGAVKISNMDFVNGKNESSQLAGGINNLGGSLELENCAFVGNTGDIGGAILNKGTLTIQNCAFQSNSAAEGGAIYNDSLSSISIEDSEFVNNTASVMGGAIENCGQLIIDGSTFNENSADGDGGGAIFTGHSTSAATITSSTFTQNTAAGENGCGGAIAAAAGNFAITDSDFIENSSSSCGGAMFAAGISTTITNSVFAHNSTGNEGGGAIWSAFEITIENSTFDLNTASGGFTALGGAINHVDGNMSITSSVLSNNTATGGGAVSIGPTPHDGHGTPVASINNTLISNNHADESGGGIFMFTGEATIINSTISGNAATEVGGIFILPHGIVEIRNSTINDNINEGTGEYMSYVGAVVTFGDLTLTNSTIANNVGSGIKSYGATTVHHSTIAGNDSIGIEVLEDGFESTLNLVNSIIANNALDCVRMNGAGAIENINNLIETTVDGEESCGTALITDDPNLGPLADNGGPTQTMALLPGSPAINAGTNDGCPETDQRGVTRPQGSQCDIGAYEYQDITPPAVIGFDPEDEAINTPVDQTISVTFSEAIDPVTVNEATIRLTPFNSNDTIPANFSTIGNIVTITPNAPLAIGTTYWIQVTSGVADLAGNHPLGQVWISSFTTGPNGFIDTTSSDFAAGTPYACYISNIANGEVNLPPLMGEEFSGSLPLGWAESSSGTGSLLFDNGEISVDDAAAYYTTITSTADHRLKFAATFTGQHQRVGLAGASDFSGHWAMFGTNDTTDELYALTSDGQSTLLTGDFIGAEHTYEIIWQAGTVYFLVDGLTASASHTVVLTDLRPMISDSNPDEQSVSVDWMHFTPYSSPCTFMSRIFDAGKIVDWLNLGRSTGGSQATSCIASQPPNPPVCTPNYGFVFETRTGNTSTPDATWSNWEEAAFAIASPYGRYMQYRVILSSDSAEATSRLHSVTATYLEMPSTIRYVKWDANGLNDGASWANAYTDLQSAISAASSGDQIWVTAGTYKPTSGLDRTISFVLKNGVEIYGGFTGNETLLSQRDITTNITILSGDLSNNDAGFTNNTENTYQIVVGSGTDASAVLDGFTITGGNANQYPYEWGGGIYNNIGSPTLRNLIFNNNSASSRGGGMYNISSDSILSNVSFIGNTSYDGGGIYNINSNLEVNDSLFEDNTSENSGGALYNESNSAIILTDTVFSKNNGGISGGAILNTGSSPTANNVLFENNFAAYGGGIHNRYDSNPNFVNVSFIENTANLMGGAIYNSESSPILTNVDINNNVATLLFGGGMYSEANSSPTLTNVSFIGNSAGSNGGAMYNHQQSQLTLTNVIFSGNNANGDGGGIYNSSSSLTLINSTLNQNSATAGAGIFNAISAANIINSTFFNNQSSDEGGGIFNTSGTLTIINSTFSGNSAGADGGGIFEVGSSLTLENTIIANSVGGDCIFIGGSITSKNSLLESTGFNACGLTHGVDGNIIGSDPNLGVLTGSPAYLPLLAGSPAINAGDDGSCPATDQRGVARPQGSQCDIGAYEYLDDIPPDVSSITRANSNPTTLPSLTFTVAFSESVMGVDAVDFELFTNGVSDASITGVSGSDDTYTVTVDTGSGNGSIRLDLIDDDSIEDLFGNKLGDTGVGNGTFTSGEPYTILKMPVKPVGIPRLSLPRRNSITNDATPTFIWTNVVNAHGYEIVIATDSAFTQVVLSETVSSPTFTPSVSLDDGRLFWRVRALNSAAQPGRFSFTQTFTIDTTAPNTPTLTSPMDAASLRLTPVFRWTRVAGAVLYEFQYDNDENFSSPTYSMLLRTNYRKPPAIPNGTHFWRVRARDAAGNWSEWSAPYEVTIN